MKKTISALVAAVMASVMSITSFAAPTLPDILPSDGGITSALDTILEIVNTILGFVGTIAGMLFK